MTVVSDDINGATHARAAIRPIVAVEMNTRGAALERREDCVDDALSVRVWPGLEADVSDIGDTLEAELLSKEVAGLVRSVGDIERESDVVQPARGGTVKLPITPNEGEGQ